MPRNPIRAIDLFAGIGGIRLGFEEVFGRRFQTVFVSEINANARKTYFANFSDSVAVRDDITKVQPEDVPAFDVCLAGFPCQAFSIAGKKLGFDDDYKGLSRGTLFHEVVRLCGLRNPKVIFCENVKGLPMHDHGQTFKIIKGALSETGEFGYNVYSKVLNSLNYGVPQTRERIYIICIRKDIDPLKGDESLFPWPKAKEGKPVLRDIIEKEPVSVKYYLSETYLTCLERHRAYHHAKGDGFGYKIRSWDEPGGTLVCGGMGRERNLIIDPRRTDLTPVTRIHGEVNKDHIRKLTPRECARMQGFPDDFVFPVGDSPAYMQLGNSVSVPVIKAIALQIKGLLKL